jgi:hypothetical protein
MVGAVYWFVYLRGGRGAEVVKQSAGIDAR